MKHEQDVYKTTLHRESEFVRVCNDLFISLPYQDSNMSLRDSLYTTYMFKINIYIYIHI